MSEATINDLPAEIIIAILRKVESRKNAALTCKLWKELIESSCSWSISIDFVNMGELDEPWIDFLLTTNRKFSKIKIEGLVGLETNRIIDIIPKHGLHITKLCLFHCCLAKIDLFIEMLKCMPNLEHLILYETTGVSIPTDDKLPELNKLKTLEVVHSDANILNCFKRSKLIEFKVLNENRTIHPDPTQELLRSQPHIKTLALRSVDSDTSLLFQTDMMNNSDEGSVQFQLTRLSLLDIKLRESPNDYNNLLKFLKPQAKTIKALELGGTFPDLVYEFIFVKFKNLKSLQLLINELPKDLEFYGRLDENQSIVQLTILDSPPPNHLNNGCPPSLEAFIRHVPNVTDLTLLEYCDRGPLQFMATNLKNLKRLAVTNFSGSIFGGLQFPNLKTLCIHQMEDDVDWEKFSKANPDLTELTIQTGSFTDFSDWSEKSFTNFVEHIMRNLRLEILRIGSRFPVSESFYEIIRKFGTELKLLDLHKACALDIPIVKEISSLQFHDDDDMPILGHQLEIWNDDDYDGRLPDIDRGGNWDDGENFLDPFDMHLMDIDDDDYDQVDDFYDDYDDFVDDYEEASDFDD